MTDEIKIPFDGNTKCQCGADFSKYGARCTCKRPIAPGEVYSDGPVNFPVSQMTDEIKPKTDREICDAATPGPWVCDIRVGVVAVYPGEKRNCLEDGGRDIIRFRGFSTDDGWDTHEQDRLDARFVAHFRTRVPEMLDELAAKDAEIERLRKERDEERRLKDEARCQICSLEAWSRHDGPSNTDDMVANVAKERGWGYLYEKEKTK